jgi:hypothetical protein
LKIFSAVSAEIVLAILFYVLIALGTDWNVYVLHVMMEKPNGILVLMTAIQLDILPACRTHAPTCPKAAVRAQRAIVGHG